jgi:ABC-type phosphate transport system substrate-binding protein
MSVKRILPVLFMSFILTACNAAGTSSAPTLLKVAGSTSTKPLLVELTMAYSAENPDVTFDIQEGGHLRHP